MISVVAFIVTLPPVFTVARAGDPGCPAVGDVHVADPLLRVTGSAAQPEPLTFITRHHSQPHCEGAGGDVAGMPLSIFNVSLSLFTPMVVELV